MPKRLRPVAADRKGPGFVFGAAALSLAAAIAHYSAPPLSPPAEVTRDTVQAPAQPTAALKPPVPARKGGGLNAAALPAVPPRQSAGTTIAALPAVPMPDRKPVMTKTPATAMKPAVQTGRASWYDFSTRKTASGEVMDGAGLTAAHRSLPFGTEVLIENLKNGRAVVVRINDRGPFARGRIIDVSKEAAEALGMIRDGVATVRVSPAGGFVAASAE